MCSLGGIPGLDDGSVLEGLAVGRVCIFFFSSRRRHTRYWRDWSSDVCSSDLVASRTSLSRSWVSGRGGTTPCCAKAMAVASTAPIQMGRYRSPETSLSSTIGWFEGISTRTPITSTSRTRRAYLSHRGRSGASQTGLDQRGVQSHCEGGELAGCLLSAGAGRGIGGSA